jgi:hypothetical protein
MELRRPRGIWDHISSNVRYGTCFESFYIIMDSLFVRWICVKSTVVELACITLSLYKI